MPVNFPEALHARGPAPDRADKLGLFAWLVGRWDMHGAVYLETGKHEARGEIHAGWVLEGRAIQDVWILPGMFYGTTLRVYDPGLGAWHILWSDPLKQYYSRQLGRASVNGIVQEGSSDAGVHTRWSFTLITPSSFHWTGERLVHGGDWATQAEFFARRTQG